MKGLHHLPKCSGIYRITCTTTGRGYIGSSFDIRKRCSQHQTNLRGGYHDNIKLQRSWKKYGEASFRVELLEESEPELLFEREQEWLDALRPEFNLSPNADGPLRGIKMSSSQRKKLQPYWDARKGVPVNPVGEHLSGTHRANISLSLRGNRRRRGKKTSGVTKSKLSRSLKEAYRWFPRSEEWRRKISSSLKGHVISEETKMKISLAQKRYHDTHENPMKGKARPDLSKRNRERVWTKEERAAACLRLNGRLPRD